MGSLNDSAARQRSSIPDYAELHCLSNFTFLRGASHPEELVSRAHELGYRAIAITDECSLSGVVRAYERATELGVSLLVGSELQLQDGSRVAVLAPSRKAYAQLSRLITLGRRNAPKGEYCLYSRDVETSIDQCLLLLLPGAGTMVPADQLDWFATHFRDRGWIAVELLHDGFDQQRLQQLDVQGKQVGLPLVATGNVHMHRRSRRALQDLLTAIRFNTPVAELGQQLYANGERHLRSREALLELYPDALLQESVRIAERCQFSLAELHYQYPDDVTPEHLSPAAYLRQLTEEGMRNRWPSGCPDKVRQQIEYELGLISELQYEAYFLTVWDIVRFAREQDILCQGRGSAANSAVCFCLGITEVDPARMNILFERFISRERNEPPDIDVDFEHHRREEVIQYIYGKYGRDRAALAATLITYRPRSALRDTARALGMPTEQIEQLSAAVIAGWHYRSGIQPEYLREVGLDPDNPVIRRVLVLANELLGFPRHLSQHVGGFVIAREHLPDLVPIENAAMPDRTVIQWDKNDIETLGLLKVDVLGLGMLSAIRRAFSLIRGYSGRQWEMASLPAEDPVVYAMLQQGDSVGVFQVESRAQMSMLPRLKPACFYDLVIEVAIVRPGPIQGDMVHPYLRRRQGKEVVTYPSESVREVTERTLGVPIFQEQVIKLAMVAAGFTPGEADQLRRAMASWSRRGGIGVYEQKLKQGMRDRGYSEDFAERVFRQIMGFGEYGFPESHAASFALLVYVSAWLKCHEPAAFTAALINSLPMGFYAPAQLVSDAREHGVEVRPADVQNSDWDCTLELQDDRPVLRLGLRLVSGLSQAGAERISQERHAGKFQRVDELADRAGLNRSDLKALAAADALSSLSTHRHRASWDVAGVEAELPVLAGAGFQEQQPQLLPPSAGQEVLADYAHMGLSLRQHPLSLLRDSLRQQGYLNGDEIAARKPGSMVHAVGLVLVRQRPGKGNVTFVTLEDETGSLNLVIWQQLAERQRKILLGAKLLGVWAEIQRADGVQHLICRKLENHSGRLEGLAARSRDYH